MSPYANGSSRGAETESTQAGNDTQQLSKFCTRATAAVEEWELLLEKQSPEKREAGHMDLILKDSKKRANKRHGTRMHSKYNPTILVGNLLVADSLLIRGP